MLGYTKLTTRLARWQNNLAWYDPFDIALYDNILVRVSSVIELHPILCMEFMNPRKFCPSFAIYPRKCWWSVMLINTRNVRGSGALCFFINIRCMESSYIWFWYVIGVCCWIYNQLYIYNKPIHDIAIYVQHKVIFVIGRNGHEMQKNIVLNLGNRSVPADAQTKYGYMTVWDMRRRIRNHDGLWWRLFEHRFEYADIEYKHPGTVYFMVGRSLSWPKKYVGMKMDIIA